MILKIPQREQFAVLSISWHINLPIAVSMTREAWHRIGQPEQIKFSELLADIKIKGGIDYTIEYPCLTEYYLRSIAARKDIVSVTIEDGFDHVFGYIASKNSWGRRVITQLNKVINKTHQKSYLNLLQLPYRDSKDKKKMEEIFFQHFINSR